MKPIVSAALRKSTDFAAMAGPEPAVLGRARDPARDPL